MTTIFNYLCDSFKTKTSLSVCLEMSREMIDKIFRIGSEHSLFGVKNFGFHDRQNTVYCMVGTFFDIKDDYEVGHEPTNAVVEKIFQAGVNHGLFEAQEAGFFAKKHSVYLFIETLLALNAVEA